MSAVAISDLARLKVRYRDPEQPPTCPRCGGDMRLDTSVRGESSPPRAIYRCPGDNAWVGLPLHGDPEVIRLIEAYEELTEQVRVRPL